MFDWWCKCPETVSNRVCHGQSRYVARMMCDTRVPTNVYIIYMLYIYASVSALGVVACLDHEAKRAILSFSDLDCAPADRSCAITEHCTWDTARCTWDHCVPPDRMLAHFYITLEILSGWSVTVPLHNEQCSLNIPNCTLVVPTAVQRNCNASFILKSSTATPLF